MCVPVPLCEKSTARLLWIPGLGRSQTTDVQNRGVTLHGCVGCYPPFCYPKERILRHGSTSADSIFLWLWPNGDDARLIINTRPVTLQGLVTIIPPASPDWMQPPSDCRSDTRHDSGPALRDDWRCQPYASAPSAVKSIIPAIKYGPPTTPCERNRYHLSVTRPIGFNSLALKSNPPRPIHGTEHGALISKEVLRAARVFLDLCEKKYEPTWTSFVG